MLNYRYRGQLYSLRSAGSLITLRYSILYSSVAAIVGYPCPITSHVRGYRRASPAASWSAAVVPVMKSDICWCYCLEASTKKHFQVTNLSICLLLPKTIL